MRPPRFRLRSLLVLVALMAVVMGGLAYLRRTRERAVHAELARALSAQAVGVDHLARFAEDSGDRERARSLREQAALYRRQAAEHDRGGGGRTPAGVRPASAATTASSPCPPRPARVRFGTAPRPSRGTSRMSDVVHRLEAEIRRQFDERNRPPEAVAPAHGWVAVNHQATTRPYVLGAPFDAQPAGARAKLIALASRWCREGYSFWDTFPVAGPRRAQLRWLSRRGYKLRPATVRVEDRP